MNLDINRIIDQLVASNHTNGELTAELSHLQAKYDELSKKFADQDNILEDMKVKLSSEESSFKYWYDRAVKAEAKLKELTPSEDISNAS